MNHFEVHLMASSRVADSKVLRMAIQFQHFFTIKRQNGKCNVRNFRQLLFGMSPDVPVPFSLEHNCFLPSLDVDLYY